MQVRNVISRDGGVSGMIAGLKKNNSGCNHPVLPKWLQINSIFSLKLTPMNRSLGCLYYLRLWSDVNYIP